jgi:hypothetical protein
MERTLIAACMTMAFAGAVQAADKPCDFALTDGKVESGKLISAKIDVDILMADGTTIPTGTKIKAGTITGGVVTKGVLSGGRHVEARCGGSALSLGSLGGVTLKDVTAALPAGEKKIAEVRGASIVEAELREVTVVDPVGPMIAKKDPVATTEDSALPLAGDWFKLKTQVNNIHLGEHPADQVPTRTGLRAPRNACFRVATEITKTGGDAPGKYARGTFYAPENNNFWTVLTSPTMWVPPYNCATADEYVDRHEVPADEQIDIRKTHDIPRELLASDRDRYRNGFTYGVMVAPFKYFRESKTFDAGGNIGPYVGYRLWDRQGSSTALIASVGVTSTKVVTVNNGVSNEETKTGMSWAFGVLTEFKSAFNVGVLWGMDMFSAADAVPKSGGHWLSISIGYKLAN